MAKRKSAKAAASDRANQLFNELWCEIVYAMRDNERKRTADRIKQGLAAIKKSRKKRKK
jgi:hypothetical protein